MRAERRLSVPVNDQSIAVDCTIVQLFLCWRLPASSASSHLSYFPETFRHQLGLIDGKSQSDKGAELISMRGVEHSTGFTIFSWILRIVAAAILLQTLYFKFTVAPESVYIFTKVGAEPWGRIGSGIIELIAAILLLTLRYTCVMAAAILSHLTLLGIEVQGDKGLLFSLALTVFFATGLNLFLHRTEIPILGRRLV